MLAAAPTHHESAELDSITPQIRLADSNNVQSWNDAVGSDTRHPATEASFDSTSAIDNLASGYMILEDDQDGPDTCLDQNANEYESIIDESSVYDPADYQQAPLPLELESHPSHDIPAADLDVIRQVMSSIQLPTPSWASAIPEHKWLPVFKSSPASNNQE